jgi:OOP family OmpA-OmpF porin
MKKIALVTLLSAVVATPALADNTGTFYGALDLGQVSFSNNGTSQLSNTPFQNPGSLRFVGGYKASPIFAIEAGYAMIGSSSITTIQGLASATETMKTSSLQLAGVATYPINDAFGVFGKVGIAHNKADYTAIPAPNTVFAPSIVTAASGSQTNFMYGLGAQFSIHKQFAIRIQYDDFGKVNLVRGASDLGLTMLSVGAVVSF